MKTADLHIRIAPDLLDAVRAQAEREDRDLTRCITAAIRLWLDHASGAVPAGYVPPPVKGDSRPAGATPNARVAEMSLAEAKAARFAGMQKAR